MIAGILGLVTGGAKWWLIGAVALSVAGYVATSQLVLHNRQKEVDRLATANGVLQGQVDQLAEINDHNVAELARIRADADRAMADVSAELGRARRAGQRLVVIRQEHARDPDAKAALDRACPARDRYLDRLLHERAAAPDRDEDRARPGAAPAPVAPVPGGAGAPARPADRRG